MCGIFLPGIDLPGIAWKNLALPCLGLPEVEENGSSVRFPNMLHAQQDLPTDIQGTLTFPTLSSAEVAGQNYTGCWCHPGPHTLS